MRVVYATADPVDADFVAMVLRDHEIDSMIDGVGGLYPDGLMPAGQPCRILVIDERWMEAREIIDEALARRRAAAGRSIQDPGSKE